MGNNMKKSFLLFILLIFSVTAVFAGITAIIHRKLQAMPMELIKKQSLKYPDIYKYVGVKGKYLKIRTVFSGGCQKHIFKLLWTGKQDPSGETPLYFVHSTPIPDRCEALINQNLEFDISHLPRGTYYLSSPDEDFTKLKNYVFQYPSKK